MTSPTKSTTMTRRLRELLARPQALMAPGAADALTARLVARQGFEAIYMSGAGTTAVRLGMPDIGLLTMGEMADNAQRIDRRSLRPAPGRRCRHWLRRGDERAPHGARL